MPRTARGRRGRRRPFQVHADQPLHAGAHAARRALPRFQRAHAGDRRRAGGAGARPRQRLRPDRRGERARQSGGRAAGRRRDQSRARRRPRNQGGPFLFRQLRRPDDSGRYLGVHCFISPARRSLVLELAHVDVDLRRCAICPDAASSRRGDSRNKSKPPTDRGGARACRARPSRGAVQYATPMRVLDEKRSSRPQIARWSGPELYWPVIG